MAHWNPIRHVRLASCAIAASTLLIGTNAGAATATDTFQVLVEIQKTCSVSAGAGSNINIGTLSSSAVNSTGNNDISVTCTKGTPYYIGLAPSAANGGNTAGSGAMASTSGTGNTDLVPYQLQQTAGAGGTVWGNTATTSSAGNGVAGTGTGVAQSHTVHAVVPSANYAADTYADTVTVTVNY